MGGIRAVSPTIQRWVDRSPLRSVARALVRRPDWVVPEDEPRRCRPLDDFRLFAVLGVWMEADIVEACVHNALRQGCERVYVVDNASPDGTAEAARRAGAVLATSFSTAAHDERLRIDIMNAVVRRASEESGAPHVWWLWLDGDEFPHGPAGTTIRGFLQGLDSRYRVVGARYFEHYPAPGRGPVNIPGRHPLDCQPDCEEQPYDWCPARHQKHPLLRFDRAAARVVALPGFHRAESSQRLREPRRSVFVHHFPYRERAVTQARLELLCQPGADGASRIAGHEATVIRAAGGSNASRRLRCLDAVYTGRWSEVLAPRGAATGPVGVHPRPWPSWVDAEDARVARWYPDVDAGVPAAARSAGGPGPGR